MDFIVNGNSKIVVEVKPDQKGPVLQKEAVNMYSKALHKIKVKGGRR